MKKLFFYCLMALTVAGCGHWKTQIDFDGFVKCEDYLLKDSYCITKLDYVWFNRYYEKQNVEFARELKLEIQKAYPSLFKERGTPVTVSLRVDKTRDSDDEILNVILSFWTMGVIPFFQKYNYASTLQIELNDGDVFGGVVPPVRYFEKSEIRTSMGVIPVALMMPYSSPDNDMYFDKGWYFNKVGNADLPVLAKAIGVAIISRLVDYEEAKTNRIRKEELRRGPKIDINQLPF